MQKLRFQIQDKEAGNYIDSFATIEEAQEELKKYEKNDKKDGIYEPDFYEIFDNVEEIVSY